MAYPLTDLTLPHSVVSFFTDIPTHIIQLEFKLENEKRNQNFQLEINLKLKFPWNRIAWIIPKLITEWRIKFPSFNLNSSWKLPSWETAKLLLLSLMLSLFFLSRLTSDMLFFARIFREYSGTLVISCALGISGKFPSGDWVYISLSAASVGVNLEYSSACPRKSIHLNFNLKIQVENQVENENYIGVIWE